jgi:hypothetical protein
MAIEKIIEMIDAYITELQSARTVLAERREGTNQTDQLASRPKRKQKHVATKSAAGPSTLAMVAVQVLPPKMPRNHRIARAGTMEHTALGGPIRQGPVVVRSAEVAEIAEKRSKAAAESKAVNASGNILQELAQEVTRRLGQGGRSRLN